MRHNRAINHLGRTSAHRKALMSNMATSLILHKRIETTLAKAKVLQQYVEPIINRSKTDTTHSRRMVFRKLQSNEGVTELFREIAQKVVDRNGGYTRIIKLGNRQGDNSETCFIELVDFNEVMSKSGAKTTKTKTVRRSRKKKSTDVADAVVVDETQKTAVSEEKVAEETKKAKTTKTKTVKSDKVSDKEKKEKSPSKEKSEKSPKSTTKKTKEKNDKK